MNTSLAAAIGAQLGTPLTTLVPVGSGFTANWRGEAGGQRVFIKLAADLDRLTAEADGLAALAACREVAVPAVLAWGEAEGKAFLALTWLDLEPAGDPARLGEALAALHDHLGDTYGWHRNNYLGATPQENGPDSDWPAFFARRRLLPQLARARRNGYGAVADAGEKLLPSVPSRLDHRPPTALLHGDLWHGNVGFVGGRPCLFDPAVHHGDPECDLAMADLFGGFDPRFFSAYGACRPPPAGWRERRRLYQLYHLLNHLNLFGAGYLAPVLAAFRELG